VAQYLFRRQSNGDVLAVEGREIRAWVTKDPDSPKGMRAVPVPDDIKQRFAGRD
jgi:hypothetical protein